MPVQQGATPNPAHALSHAARVCALAVLLVGLVVLAGWALKIEALKSVLPGLASMKPNTALGLVLAGIALALRQRSGLRLGCAAAMVVLGGLSLAQDVSGADFGVDQLLFRDLPGAAQTVWPGRMAPITAVNMVLLGGALALIGTRRTALRRTLEALALLALALALPALIGYAYGTKSFYPLPGFGSMALPTALALPLLALGILCARADGLAGVFASAGLGGQVARRFLPLALIAPVLLGWLAQMGENAGLFIGPQNTAIFAVAMMLVLVAVTGHIAHSLEASDAERQRAESALRENEQRLRLAADAAELGIWTWQPEGDRIAWENERPYDILGMPRTDAPLTAARFAAEFVHPEDLAAFEQAIAATLQTGARLFYQGRFHCPNGDLRWIEFTGQAVQSVQSVQSVQMPVGPSLRVIGTVRDITERKQAEQLLRQNHDTFFNLIQNAPFGLYIVDAQFRLRQVSSAAQKVFSNISPLLGRDFEEVLRLVWTEPFVSDALGHFRHTLATGQPYAAPNTTEQRQNIPDVESYDWKIERITLPDGQFGVVCYFYDITERMQAAQALRESEAFSRSILKSSPDCVKVLDLEGNLLSMQSGQELLGIEDILPFLNKSWFDFWANGDKPAVQAAIKSALAGGVGNFVGFFRTLRGEVKWWDVLISPILDTDGKPARLLAVSRDVTQRQQTDTALRQRTAQFETLVNEAPLGVLLIDADFRVRQVNPKALPAYGNLPDLIGRDYAEVLHILRPKAQADQAINQFHHTLATGEACYVPEMIETRADRQTTGYYEWQINRIPLADGRQGVVCYFRDISERVLAQQKISDSEARYRSLFNSIDEGFCVIEMIFDAHAKAIDYRFLEVNPAFEPQTGIHAATGKRMREIAPDHDEHWFEVFGKVTLTGVAVRFVSEAKALGGRWFDVYAFRLGGPESSKVALLFGNITARRRSEAALRESNEELIVFNLVAIGRELRMIELKHDINALCALAGQPPRFALVIEEGRP